MDALEGPENEGKVPCDDAEFRLRPMAKYILSSPTYRRRDVLDYLRIELPDDERVTHCERIDTAFVGASKHEVWDVHTERERYWVITNLTNLYEQSVFPSMDMCLTFHVGYMTRMRRLEDLSQEGLDLFIPATTKRLERARRALESAEEADEFQSVGLRCREALLSMVREVCRADMVPPEVVRPKRSDFLAWIDILCDWVTVDDTDGRLRATMKASARNAWQLANWLTHSTGSYMHGALQTFNQCEYAINQLNWARFYRKDGSPQRCPVCESYRLILDLERTDDGYKRSRLCDSCGWSTEEM